MYATKRADIIAIPSSWSGHYAGPVLVDVGLLIKPFPENTMTLWYNIAKYAQAYTLVANYVGGKEGYKGSSALYSLDPIQGHYVPEIASATDEAAFRVNFETLGSPDWWMTQQYMIIGQRTDLNAPLTLKNDSDCFLKWLKDSTGNDFCWNH